MNPPQHTDSHPCAQSGWSRSLSWWSQDPLHAEKQPISHRKSGTKLDLGSGGGGLGKTNIVNVKRKVARKLRRIILFQFGLVINFSISRWETRETIIVKLLVYQAIRLLRYSSMDRNLDNWYSQSVPKWICMTLYDMLEASGNQQKQKN